MNFKKYSDFNHKNIALILGTVLVLGLFLLIQGGAYKSASTLKLTLGKENSVFASGAPATQVASNNASNSAVLGASTLSPALESQISALPVTKSSRDTVSAGQAYAAQVSVVESADSSNSSKLASDLLAIAVPPSLADYQRLIIVRAELQAQLAASTSSGQQQVLQTSISAVNQQITQEQGNFSGQGIDLPS